MSDAPTPPVPPTPPSAPEPPRYGQPYYPPATTAGTNLPAHEHASLALGLGIVGLLGGFMCIGLLASPFAIGFGVSARRAIRAEPQRWGGEGMATAGIVLGVIGVLVLAVVMLIGVALAIGLMRGAFDLSTTTTGGVST